MPIKEFRPGRYPVPEGCQNPHRYTSQSERQNSCATPQRPRPRCVRSPESEAAGLFGRRSHRSGFSGCTCDKMAGQKMFWAQQEGWGTKRPERNRTRKHLRTGKYIIPGYGRRQPFTQASPDAGIIASTAHAAANKTETRAAHDATQAGVTPNAALPFLRKFKA